jgi:hypothetical protein
MTRLEYNLYRNWTLPSDENGDDEGYLVEYVDGGDSNHPDHKGYISWSPKSVFENSYKNSDTYIDRMEIEFGEVYERYDAGSAYADKCEKNDRESGTVCEDSRSDLERIMLQDQLYVMQSYLQALGSRIAFAKAKEGLL